MVETEDSVALLPKASAEVRCRVTRLQKAAYGVGHVMNDICAAMWFSYTLLFFHVVLAMPPVLAGTMLLIGKWNKIVPKKHTKVPTLKKYLSTDRSCF